MQYPALAVLVIPAAVGEPLELTVLPPSSLTQRLTQLQTAVAGQIEVVPITRAGANLIVNADGKTDSLPLNVRASEVWAALLGERPHVAGVIDYVVGDALLVGDDGGSDLSSVTAAHLSVALPACDRMHRAHTALRHAGVAR